TGQRSVADWCGMAPSSARRFASPVPRPVSWTPEGDIDRAPPSSIVAPDATVRSRVMGHAVNRAARAAPGGLMPEPLDEPLSVVGGDGLGDDPPCLGETLEAMEIEALLLERADQPPSSVQKRVASIRHISSGRMVVMVPAWTGSSFGGPRRLGASN